MNEEDDDDEEEERRQRERKLNAVHCYAAQFNTGDRGERKAGST